MNPSISSESQGQQELTSPSALPEISQSLIIDLIELLRKVLETSGKGQRSEQMQELIEVLYKVEVSINDLKGGIDQLVPAQAEVHLIQRKLDGQGVAIKELHHSITTLTAQLLQPLEQVD